jgi:poly-gamma-glutamate synthesis protein (capsule biosynthesis protein)
MRFTFDSQVTEILKNNNFKGVSLANNHIFDFGRVGVEQTKVNLAKSGIKWFGDPVDLAHKTLVEDSYVIVGFNQFLGVDSVEDTKKEIKKYKQEGRFVIVFAHWGEEYLPKTEYQKDWAYQFVDSGADMVIGAHPHVIQESEVYKNKYIYYSLGNFVFDQWWEESVGTGLGVEVVLREGDNVVVRELKFKSGRDGRTCPV